jgi:opacity protein-like surface antigen
MKRNGQLVLALALMVGLCASPALASGDANLLFGQKSLSGVYHEGSGVDGQSQMGVAVSIDFQWPVMLAVDLLTSSKDNMVVVEAQNPLQFWTDVQTTEVDVGVRKFWERDKLRPYIGGGLAYVELDALQIESGDFGVPGSEYSDVIVDDSDSAVGFWVNAGLLYRVGRYINIGIDVRFSDADADLMPNNVDSTLTLDSGGTHYGILFGYHW